MSKFLSYGNWMIIAQNLQGNAFFWAIGKELGKDRTTIVKGIKKYSMKIWSQKTNQKQIKNELKSNQNKSFIYYTKYGNWSK